MYWLWCTHKSDPVLPQYAWDKPESPHVETRFIASKKLARYTDAINRRLYREYTRQLFLDRLLFPTFVYTVAL
ncbi:hypothetical protein [Nostoc sphaeroides]|uniref:Uncharacterized protein n=1 Tax=Nostoc sphaeroides CCNUC1 TaxID=2653204 RepID=A0A5P8W0E8_9NOSO|nr:hypothetical protein [Nostoc sphaeroides]MCC5630016.1 hypothetical protein [Nostoc sphaeroides CHAB 2801]QFS45756.1 hypothetical protein GXM_03233 [Nostoc sphaeroides CCNUC1]